MQSDFSTFYKILIDNNIKSHTVLPKKYLRKAALKDGEESHNY